MIAASFYGCLLCEPKNSLHVYSVESLLFGDKKMLLSCQIVRYQKKLGKRKIFVKDLRVVVHCWSKCSPIVLSGRVYRLIKGACPIFAKIASFLFWSSLSPIVRLMKQSGLYPLFINSLVGHLDDHLIVGFCPGTNFAKKAEIEICFEIRRSCFSFDNFLLVNRRRFFSRSVI